MKNTVDRLIFDKETLDKHANVSHKENKQLHIQYFMMLCQIHYDVKWDPWYHQLKHVSFKQRNDTWHNDIHLYRDLNNEIAYTNQGGRARRR